MKKVLITAMVTDKTVKKSKALILLTEYKYSRNKPVSNTEKDRHTRKRVPWLHSYTWSTILLSFHATCPSTS